MWKSMMKCIEMFGMKFPNKISITKLDEKIAERRVSEFFYSWDRDKEMRANIFKIYDYRLPKTLKCYIVTTETSATFLKRKYILLSMYIPIDKIPMVIIHEFSHIAFLQKWTNFCRELGYTKKGIKELNEVLTVINNTEYKNIKDTGYTVHKKLRKIVKRMWLKNPDLKEIISDPKIINFTNLLKTIKLKKEKRRKGEKRSREKGPSAFYQIINILLRS